MNNPKKLSEAKEGEVVTVSKITGSSAIKQRLMDMGIVRGSEIRIVRYAPLNDPMHIIVKGYSLAIRVSEANMIEIK